MQGETTVAQEQFASIFIRLRLAGFLATARDVQDETKKVICAASSGGAYHDGSLMLLAAHLKLKGWSTYYLGYNIPVQDVRSAAEQIQPKVVCLSFNDKQGIHASIDSLNGFGCKVCIGGFGALTFDDEESLPAHLTLFKEIGRQAAEVVESVFE